MAWTQQQNNAINIRNASVIVSAAAGSGKTAVLTERLAQLIADESAQIRADKIIVVTFTNDAASELRKRLDLKLRTMISENSGNKYLLKQQTLLQNAKISTINSFCFELLRDNVTDQGITSGFTILDESENKLIKKQAMDELLNYYSKEKYEEISYMYDKFCLKNDEKLEEVINEADNYLASAAMRDKWLDEAIENFSFTPENSVYYKLLISNALKNTEKALSLAETCRDMLDDIFEDDTETPFAKKSYELADEDILKITSLQKNLEMGRIPENNDMEFCCNFSRLPPARRSESINTELRELYKIRRKEFTEIVKGIAALSEGFEEDFYECRDTTIILAGMLKKYQELIWQKKCSRNAISFDDGERLVLELLIDYDEKGNIVQSETALRIAEFYDIIMIDEYQDSNNKQDLIFKLLSKNFKLSDEKSPVYGSNAFLVGDVKQSIYKFRLANPKNFINTIESSVKYTPDATSKNISITLNKNFRSSEAVIELVNFMFSKLMTKNCGDIDYNENEYLYFGAAEYKTASTVNMKTQIAFIDTDSAAAEADSEAEYTANKIREMLNGKAQVVTKNGNIRSCQPSDFCILVRKNKYTKKYIDALQKRGIEARGEEETGYLSSREITVLLDLLRVIDNPLLDIPLAAVMMSPMYMFELEELAYLKSLSKRKPLFTILNNLINNCYPECDDVFFIERCRDFLKTLNEFRLCAVTMTVGELISKIYDITDFVAVMQLYTDGAKKRANLRVLVQYAKNYEKASAFEGSGGLSGFVRYIDRVIETGSDFSQGKINSSSGNYIAIKTIHKSKGLEYPFIFLCDTSSPIKFDTPTVMCSDDSRIGFILHNPNLMRRYKTTPYKQIIEENKRDIISEELRLLYVALTRAKQQLFINMTYNEKRKLSLKKMIDDYCLYNYSIDEISCNAKCHADWIWQSLFCTSEFKKVVTKLEIDAAELPMSSEGDNLFEVIFPTCIAESGKNKESIFAEASPDMKVFESMKEIIEYKYDNSLTETPAKLSVTQIAKKFENQPEKLNFRLKRPKFMRSKNTLTGAEKGTAIHTFFQYCSFENAIASPENEISLMVEKGYISENQAKSISKRNVAAFFKSKLYARIKVADRLWREKKFMVAVADLDISNEHMNLMKKSDGMIKGIVDLVFEENGKLILVDYKSDRGVDEASLAERYSVQLQLYKAAIELTMGKKVTETYLYSFELRKEISLDI